MLTDERIDYLINEVLPHVAGCGPATFRFVEDWGLTNEDVDYLYSTGGLTDCEGCGWPVLREDVDEEGRCEDCEVEGY